MDNLNKKNILIAAIILAVIILIIIIYIVIPKKSPQQITNSANLPLSGIAQNQSNQYQNNYTKGSGSINSLPLNILTHLTTDPIAGATIVETRTGSVVRYVEKTNAHVHDIALTDGTSMTVTNTMLPAIHDSVWLNNGTYVALRYITQNSPIIQTYSALISTTTAELQGVYLPSNIESIATSPTSNKIFYLTTNTGRGLGFIVGVNSNKTTQVFDSPLTEWLTSWPASTIITLTTKASSGVNGLMYMVDLKNNSTKKILSTISGLTTNTNPTASLVAFTDDRNNLQIYSIKNNSTSFTGIKTLAEKCVWSSKNATIIYCAIPTILPAGLYPDNWYQGLLSFSDSIYKINTDTRATSLIGDLLNQYSQNIDATDLVLNKTEDYLLFTNKKDSTLWGLKLASTTTSY